MQLPTLHRFLLQIDRHTRTCLFLAYVLKPSPLTPERCRNPTPRLKQHELAEPLSYALGQLCVASTGVSTSNLGWVKVQPEINDQAAITDCLGPKWAEFQVLSLFDDGIQVAGFPHTPMQNRVR